MKREHILGGILGVAVGDALGVPVEFSGREFCKLHPVTDMIGYGTHNQPPGTWSDDSSLTFCLAQALCQGYDLQKIADEFVKWYRYGHWTPYGHVFDIGNTTLEAILKLEKHTLPPEQCGGKEERDNGNGSLMRILPIAFYVFNMPHDKKYTIVKEVSSLTHAHIRSIISCCIYIDTAINIMKGMDKYEVYAAMKKPIKEYFGKEADFRYFERIIEKDIYEIEESNIRTSGYVIDTLEASLWCLINSDSFDEAVLKAVNLGGDTDTTGAVTGGLAGLYYGYDAIPKKWIEKISRKEEIIELCNRLYEALCQDL